VERVKFSKGDYIYRQDDVSESIYVVKAGRIELTTLYPETGEGVDSSYGPGHVFGEVEVIDGRARDSSARAATTAQVMVIPRAELIELLYEKPEKSLVLGKGSFERLKDLFDDSSLDSDLARLREEMHVSIRDAVVAHESRVVKSHNGMAAIAVPIILLIVLAVGSYWFFHRS
jgi:CRP-like cAMP-binding protein